MTLLEKYIEPVYQKKIENRIIGSPKKILEGTITIYDEVSQNIHSFLEKDTLINKFGLTLDILITGKGGIIIYPYFGTLNSENIKDHENWDTSKTARDNYEILSDDLIVKLTAKLYHGTLGANLILILYIVLSLSIFLIYYQHGVSKAKKQEILKNKRIEKLINDENAQRQMLNKLEAERFDLLTKLKAVKTDFKEKTEKASITEEEMFEEIVFLEKKLNKNLEKQKKKEQEIEKLKNRLKESEREKGGHKRRKQFDIFVKRFAALYKNIDMHRKAMSGFCDLNEDLQIKAEEIIHQLNENPAKVTIKRKVFSGKKHKAASFEVLFAYNGRLYFRNIEGNRIEVLIIGTKNTQDKDMDFLHSI